MQPDQLQQLRDIHVPPPPSWWPPAPGWWLLAALCAAALAWGALLAARAYRRNRPVRQAQALHDDLYGRYQSGRLSPAAYAHESNALLKRLLIHGLGADAARRAGDSAWLDMLDHIAGDGAFSNGPGAVLGNARFQPDAQVDVPALHTLISGLLRRRGLGRIAAELTPPDRRATAAEREAGQ